MKKRILTGDRPTGKLHLGHYVGSLKNRLRLQDEYIPLRPSDSADVFPHERKYEIYLLVADLHALTTKTDTSNLKQNIKDLVLASCPWLQAADILMVRANLVPVGKDQTSHVELTREIAQKFNSTYGKVFPLPEALVPEEIGTLPGIDGKQKMSKSLDNAIFLSDNESAVREKVMKMYTDPTRIHPTDPGHVEDNPVFIYLKAFTTSKDEKKLAEYREKYKKGEIGDIEVKEFLVKTLNEFLSPIRIRRQELEKQSGLVDEILDEGNKKASAEAQNTLKLAKEAMKLP